MGDGGLYSTARDYGQFMRMIDPERGVAATLLMQVLPFHDDGALRALDRFESTLYQNLAPSP